MKTPEGTFACVVTFLDGKTMIFIGDESSIRISLNCYAVEPDDFEPVWDRLKMGEEIMFYGDRQVKLHTNTVRVSL